MQERSLWQKHKINLAILAAAVALALVSLLIMGWPETGKRAYAIQTALTILALAVVWRYTEVTARMVEETVTQRTLTVRPLLVLIGCGHGKGGGAPSFPFAKLRNAGSGPAINIAVQPVTIKLGATDIRLTFDVYSHAAIGETVDIRAHSEKGDEQAGRAASGLASIKKEHPLTVEFEDIEGRPYHQEIWCENFHFHSGAPKLGKSPQ